MGKVYTTSEDLTSIANAIRAKTGSNSSLTYPSGFVSAIGGILANAYDGYGLEPTFILTIYNESISLADTNWDNITLTTSSQTIRDATKVISTSDNTNIPLDLNYDYVMIMENRVSIAYNNEVYPRVLNTYGLLYYTFVSNKSGFIPLTTNTPNGIMVTSGIIFCSMYIDDSNALNYVTSNKGIYYNTYYGPSATLAGGITSVYAPQIKSYIDKSYFSSDAVAEVDANNTVCTCIMKLYRYKKSSTLIAHQLVGLENMIFTDYPQYAPLQS